jgi:hypothetical protein
MKCYVAYCENDRFNPAIGVFSKPDTAILFARQFMAVNVAPEYVIEETIQGYLLYLWETHEECFALVVERELD